MARHASRVAEYDTRERLARPIVISAFQEGFGVGAAGVLAEEPHDDAGHRPAFRLGALVRALPERFGDVPHEVIVMRQIRAELHATDSRGRQRTLNTSQSGIPSDTQFARWV